MSRVPERSSWNSSPNAAVPAPKAQAAPNWVSDDTFLDSSKVGGHQLFRTVQATAWSRRQNLAGREITDLRLYELSHHGLQDFGLRMLSEGRFQGLIYTRSVSESVFVQALVKKLREAQVDLDSVAQTLFEPGAAPDKHKEAMKYMQPLVQKVVQPLLQMAAKSDSNVSEELLRRREKMEAMGIQLTPKKRSRSEERDSEPASKSIRASEPMPECLRVPFKPMTSQPEGHTEAVVSQWVEKAVGRLNKAKAKQFSEHMQEVTKLLRKQDRSVLKQAALKYGLEPNLAEKMAIRNLSTLLSACQYLAA